MDSTLLESSFHDATVVLVSPDGSLPQSLFDSDTASSGALILDLRRVKSPKSIENLRDELTSSLRSRVVGVDASGIQVGEAGICALLSNIVVSCRGLVELDLSYTELSHRAVLALLDLYNVVKSGKV
jgi:hypothetical protein